MHINIKDFFIEKAFSLAAFTSLLFLFGITVILFAEGMPFFKQVSLGDFLFGSFWYPTHTNPKFGILPLMAGSLLVASIAIVIAIWLGIGSAIFLNEIASYKIKSFLKPSIEVLASIPSIVYGFFGMIIAGPFLQQILNLPIGLCAFTAGLILGIMAVPTVCSLTEDALSFVPVSFREASLAIGANRWQTMTKVVIPAAGSGISTSVILGFSRIIGETMTVLMVAGGAALIPSSIFDPVRPMTATIAAEMGETVIGSTHYHSLFAIGLVLFLITMLINILAEHISKKYRMRLGLGR